MAENHPIPKRWNRRTTVWRKKKPNPKRRNGGKSPEILKDGSQRKSKRELKHARFWAADSNRKKLRTEKTKSHKNYHICQHCGMKTSTMTSSFITFLTSPCSATTAYQFSSEIYGGFLWIRVNDEVIRRGFLLTSYFTFWLVRRLCVQVSFQIRIDYKQWKSFQNFVHF